MKVFRKKLRRIVVDDRAYRFVVDESDESAILRIYLEEDKARCCTFEISYSCYHDVNLNLPSVVSSLIRYSNNDGWPVFLTRHVYTFDTLEDLVGVLKYGTV